MTEKKKSGTPSIAVIGAIEGASRVEIQTSTGMVTTNIYTEPGPKATLDDWLAWYDVVKRQWGEKQIGKYGITLKYIARKVGRSPGTVRRRRANWAKEHRGEIQVKDEVE